MQVQHFINSGALSDVTPNVSTMRESGEKKLPFLPRHPNCTKFIGR